MLMKGHFNSELWGLACHPTKAEAYTYGRDGMLAVWDLKTKRQKVYSLIGQAGDALAISNNGKFLAIGLDNGTLVVLDSTTFRPVSKKGGRPGKAIQVIKFSPDDSIMAVGGHD